MVRYIIEDQIARSLLLHTPIPHASNPMARGHEHVSSCVTGLNETQYFFFPYELSFFFLVLNVFDEREHGFISLFDDANSVEQTDKAMLSLWMDLAFAELERNTMDETVIDVAVTDVRFRNEADYIRSPEMGGYILHVHRAETDALGARKGHASEAGIGNPNTEDFHINNFGTVKDLETQVHQVVNRIIEKEAIEESDEEVQTTAADTE